MTNIPDLNSCDYIPVECDSLVAVGWLSFEADFPKGTVPKEFFLKLKELSMKAWEPVSSAGIHYCDLCQFDAPGSYSNLYIPYRGKIYVSPVAVVHYIAVHRYSPPEEFIRAVMECPPMRSVPYFKAIKDNGGRSLVLAKQA